METQQSQHADHITQGLCSFCGKRFAGSKAAEMHWHQVHGPKAQARKNANTKASSKRKRRRNPMPQESDSGGEEPRDGSIGSVRRTINRTLFYAACKWVEGNKPMLDGTIPEETVLSRMEKDLRLSRPLTRLQLRKACETTGIPYCFHLRAKGPQVLKDNDRLALAEAHLATVARCVVKFMRDIGSEIPGDLLNLC